MRHIDCEMLVEESGRCPVCKKFRDSLFSMTSRHQKRQCTPVSSLTNVRYMNTPEKVQRIQQLKSEKRLAQKRITRLQKRLLTRLMFVALLFLNHLRKTLSAFHPFIINESLTHTQKILSNTSFGNIRYSLTNPHPQESVGTFNDQVVPVLASPIFSCI